MDNLSLTMDNSAINELLYGIEQSGSFVWRQVFDVFLVRVQPTSSIVIIQARRQLETVAGITSWYMLTFDSV